MSLQLWMWKPSRLYDVDQGPACRVFLFQGHRVIREPQTLSPTPHSHRVRHSDSTDLELGQFKVQALVSGWGSLLNLRIWVKRAFLQRLRFGFLAGVELQLAVNFKAWYDECAWACCVCVGLGIVKCVAGAWNVHRRYNHQWFQSCWLCWTSLFEGTPAGSFPCSWAYERIELKLYNVYTSQLQVKTSTHADIMSCRVVI